MSMYRRLRGSLGRVKRQTQDRVREMGHVDPGLDQVQLAHRYAADFGALSTATTSGYLGSEAPGVANPLQQFFDSRTQGAGIWKWTHYFEIYHRHLQRFVGRSVDVMEVGVYSGGSLEMWRAYFGEECRLYGVDIEPACGVYANEFTSIFIGDQEDRAFWRDVRAAVPGIDILIDDGGHQPEQQRVTLEEMLPFLRPGGVYLCEDVHGAGSGFAAFVGGLAAQLHAMDVVPGDQLTSRVSSFQAALHSIHVYPYVVVIEKRARPVGLFAAPKHGSSWQPFYDDA